MDAILNKSVAGSKILAHIWVTAEALVNSSTMDIKSYSTYILKNQPPISEDI